MRLSRELSRSTSRCKSCSRASPGRSLSVSSACGVAIDNRLRDDGCRGQEKVDEPAELCDYRRKCRPRSRSATPTRTDSRPAKRMLPSQATEAPAKRSRRLPSASSPPRRVRIAPPPSNHRVPGFPAEDGVGDGRDVFMQWLIVHGHAAREPALVLVAEVPVDRAAVVELHISAEERPAARIAPHPADLGRQVEIVTLIAADVRIHGGKR